MNAFKAPEIEKKPSSSKRLAASHLEEGESRVQPLKGFDPPPFQLKTSPPREEEKQQPSPTEGVVQEWGIFDSISRGAGMLWSGAKNLAGKAWDNTKDIAGKAWSGAKNMAGKAWDSTKDIAGKAWSGAKNLAGKAWNTTKNIAGKAWSGAKNLAGKAWSGIKGIASKVWSKLSGPKGTAVNPEDVPSDHILLEYAAHHVAYNPQALRDPEQSAILQRAGYDTDNNRIETGPKGFQAVLIMPGRSGLRPILAIRGTDDMAGVSTDLDIKQVGDLQYKLNRGKIISLLQSAGGKVNLTGHSLGGAMAQIIAANHTGSVGKIVTFQSPGISASEVAKFNAVVPADRPEVYHHIANNDLVDLAGEASLPGTFYEHELKGWNNPLAAHTSFVFGTEGFRRQRGAMGLTDDFYKQELGKDMYKGSPSITRYDAYPHPYKRAGAEPVRKGAGAVKEAGGAIASGLGQVVEGVKNMGSASVKGLKNALKWAKGLFS